MDEVTYTFKFKPEGWQPEVLDQGSYYIENVDGQDVRKPFTDEALNPILGNLDGAGGAEATGNPVFIGFTVYGKNDFNELNLGPF